jgi:hypothetical protein
VQENWRKKEASVKVASVNWDHVLKCGMSKTLAKCNSSVDSFKNFVTTACCDEHFELVPIGDLGLLVVQMSKILLW